MRSSQNEQNEEAPMFGKVNRTSYVKMDLGAIFGILQTMQKYSNTQASCNMNCFMRFLEDRIEFYGIWPSVLGVYTEAAIPLLPTASSLLDIWDWMGSLDISQEPGCYLHTRATKALALCDDFAKSHAACIELQRRVDNCHMHTSITSLRFSTNKTSFSHTRTTKTYRIKRLQHRSFLNKIYQSNNFKQT